MEILQYTADMQTSVTQFYNRLTADVPHCYPIKAEEFAIAMRGVTTGKADKKEGGLDSEAAFVAMVNGAVSDALDQVQALLGYNGYHRSEDEVFLDWENYTVTPVRSSLPIFLLKPHALAWGCKQALRL